MPTGANLEVAVSGDRRTRLEEFGRIEQSATTVALIAARSLVSAVRAGSDDVPVGQEATVLRRPHLPHLTLLDQPGRIEAPIEVLGQSVILRRRRATEVIEGQGKSAVDLGLNGMLLVAIGAYALSGCGGGQFGRGTVLVGAANEQDIGTGLPAKSCVDIGRQQ